MIQLGKDNLSFVLWVHEHQDIRYRIDNSITIDIKIVMRGHTTFLSNFRELWHVAYYAVKRDI